MFDRFSRGDKKPAAGGAAAPGWAWRSRANWSRPTAGKSRSPVAPVWELRLSLHSRQRRRSRNKGGTATKAATLLENGLFYTAARHLAYSARAVRTCRSEP